MEQVATTLRPTGTERPVRGMVEAPTAENAEAGAGAGAGTLAEVVAGVR